MSLEPEPLVMIHNKIQRNKAIYYKTRLVVEKKKIKEVHIFITDSKNQHDWCDEIDAVLYTDDMYTLNYSPNKNGRIPKCSIISREDTL